MVSDAKKTDETTLSEGISREKRDKRAGEYMSIEDLKASQASVLENIGALRYSINQMQILEGYRLLMRDLLEDCKAPLAVDGQSVLVARIEHVLMETHE